MNDSEKSRPSKDTQVLVSLFFLVHSTCVTVEFSDFMLCSNALSSSSTRRAALLVGVACAGKPQPFKPRAACMQIISTHSESTGHSVQNSTLWTGGQRLRLLKCRCACEGEVRVQELWARGRTFLTAQRAPLCAPGHPQWWPAYGQPLGAAQQSVTTQRNTRPLRHTWEAV